MYLLLIHRTPNTPDSPYNEIFQISRLRKTSGKGIPFLNDRFMLYDLKTTSIVLALAAHTLKTTSRKAKELYHILVFRIHLLLVNN